MAEIKTSMIVFEVVEVFLLVSSSCLQSAPPPKFTVISDILFESGVNLCHFLSVGHLKKSAFSDFLPSPLTLTYTDGPPQPNPSSHLNLKIMS